ncbi:MAG: transposase [Candidatus Thorarchaeota archaeon]
MLGEKLESSKGQGYVVLREEEFLEWKPNNQFGQLVFERMYRNVLETAARIILSGHTRTRLVGSLLTILTSDSNELKRVMTNKRIPADLVRKVRESVGKKSGSYYHYALAACRQVQKALDIYLLDRIGESSSARRIQRSRVREIFGSRSKAVHSNLQILERQVVEWSINGFPFTIPLFRQTTMEFAASTENSTGQGYWFRLDPERDDEVILFIKTPPGVTRHERAPDSPYRSQTLRFRFLDWLPRKAARSFRKAEEARVSGHFQRAVELEFRAARFMDMSQQLRNTIRLQHLTQEVSLLKYRKNPNEKRIAELKSEKDLLRKKRRCAPPVLKVRGHRVTLHIPFMAPDVEMLRRVLPQISRKKRAGVDRGLRHPVVLSVRNGRESYDETKIGRAELYEKRKILRQRTRVLMSQISRRRNNWDKKRAMEPPPSHILKKERELEAVWRKVRRIDREIAHQLAAETVWFCEHRGVKTIHFEDLRYFQPKGGSRTYSWELSTNLWGKIIEGVRYRRQHLGHKYGGVWTINPAMTSQRCSACGERGVRVRDTDSIEEERGGEYFYCSSCEFRLHADVNAARNILKIQTRKPSAVSGRTA